MPPARAARGGDASVACGFLPPKFGGHVRARFAALALKDYNAAVEFAECRNLVKGYGDTLERGRASFVAIEGALERLLAGPQPAAAIARLRAAALADDTGAGLKVALG